MKIQIDDENVKRTWGIYFCPCGAKYHPRGVQNHLDGCDGRNAVYHFSTRELDAVLSRGERNRCGDLTINLLMEQYGALPEAVQDRIDASLASLRT
jgi:hypothetical protein